VKDFDKIEEELVNKKRKLRREVGSHIKKIELDRFKGI